MINQRQSKSFTGIIRKLFVIFLLFTFILTIGSFILRHTISNKLERLDSQLQEPWQQQEISMLLVDLNVAENSFQQASSNGDVAHFDAYKKRLQDILAKMVNLLQKYRIDRDSHVPKSKQQIALALQQKLAVSQQLFDLQKRFTALLNKTTLGSIRDNSSDKKFGRVNNQTDTAVSTYRQSTNKGLITRLKDAVQNTADVKVLTIKPTGSTKANSNEDQSNLLRNLGNQYHLLSQSNQELILANLNLLTELRQVLQELQSIERLAFEKSREGILQEYRSASVDLNKFTGIASAFILLFIIILIVYMRKAFGFEKRYIMENSRAVRLASQKSEILAIMSHEIRNKLMAINGAVFMLNRTPLIPQQEKPVKSISLSSYLLLETINNVLDVSKLEQSPAKLNIQTFLPHQAIEDSVEAMRFMAERKGIDLNFEFDGATDSNVNGDSLRLKQILINLLSNAIKFTDKGQVNLLAKLKNTGDAVLLNVIVEDTGSGIPKNKQAKLFSPYYQAGGLKLGTGLGLYICRQLVKLQDGTIDLESQEGKGCTVSFSIPYSPVAQDALKDQDLES